MTLKNKQFLGTVVFSVVGLIYCWSLIELRSTALASGFWVPYRDTLSRIAFAVGGILLSVILYWLRTNFRIAYGLIEILFAIAVIASIAYFTPASALFDDFSIRPDQIGGITALFGAIYIFVRGMDNIANGLNGKLTADRLWNSIFRFDWL
ncbi:hypothetical protein EFD56_30295 [Rhizobium phaseoli]|uniref:hypothetical protein n=1 Tax=Rhizobium phaseoli TaxID=396 RepID=UPI000F8660C8|nr:hypothetical protein [Rhizobium phaseoli]RUM12223.1 hypothetical protein EFD56_30295 [Rhizobium phaseoli]